MDYEGWKRALEPWLLLSTGAATLAAGQKAYRAFKGRPPCQPGELDQMYLNQMAEYDERLRQLEKAVLPIRERWWRRWQRLVREWNRQEGEG